MKKLLSVALALLMLAVMLPVTAMADESSIDLAEFITKLEQADYDFNGLTTNGTKLTVKWSPVSGCYDNRPGHDCTVENATATANTPKRVNSGLTQFQLLEGSSRAVTVKNVKFVYESAAFTVCMNSGWAGSFTAEQAPAGQLFFLTTGNVTFENCEFDKVVLTTFNTTGTSTVKDCSFKNVYNNYAIKDIRGANVSVTGTTIENCGGGIMVSSNSSDTAVNKVTLTGNTFKNVDVTGTAPDGNVGTRAIIQIASSGTYTGATLDFSGNSATNCGPVVRQLNESAAGKVNEQGSNLKAMRPDGKVFTDDTTVNEEPPAPPTPPTGGTIVIVPDRTEDTPKTEPEKNPTTGANDVVAAAVALMAVSALGMAVLTRKK